MSIYIVVIMASLLKQHRTLEQTHTIISRLHLYIIHVYDFYIAYSVSHKSI